MTAAAHAQSHENGRTVRVLHLIASLDLGGEQRYLVRLANRLDRRFEQTVVYTFAPKLRGELADHVDCVELIGRKLSARRIRDVARCQWYALEIAALMVKRRIDVVATHNPGLLHLAGVLAAKAVGRPVIHTIQRPWGNRAKTEEVVANTPGLRQLVYGLTDRFVALGSYYAFDQRERFRIPEHKLTTNYIGIDLDEYRPDPQAAESVRRERGLGAEVPLIGVVARHNPEKGVGRGILAFSHLHRVLPEARLLLVGDGPTRPQHEEEAERLGVSAYVIFAGARPDSARLMNGCDAIMQTTFNPLNGISSIEAMASGKPVLTVVEEAEEEKMAADTCAHGRNGLFLRLREPEVMARELAGVLRDRETLSRMGHYSRELAEERFDIHGHVRRIEALYDSISA